MSSFVFSYEQAIKAVESGHRVQGDCFAANVYLMKDENGFHLENLNLPVEQQKELLSDHKLLFSQLYRILAD